MMKPPCFDEDCNSHSCNGCPGVQAYSLVYDFRGRGLINDDYDDDEEEDYDEPFPDDKDAFGVESFTYESEDDPND